MNRVYEADQTNGASVLSSLRPRIFSWIRKYPDQSSTPIRKFLGWCGWGVNLDENIR